MSIEDALLTAIGQERGGAAAARLCQACVALLGVDAAAICLVFDGVNVATLGASSPAARIYDELQLTLGEGPGLDAVAYHPPVLIDDLTDSPNGEPRWLLYNQALLSHHIRAVHAVPIMMADNSIGALSVFHDRLPNWTVEHFDGVAVTAELASLLIVDLYSGDLDAGHVEPGNDT